jgi:hypothetical protein
VTQKLRDGTKPALVLRDLAEHPQGRSTDELVCLWGEEFRTRRPGDPANGGLRHRRVAWCGAILRRFEAEGRVHRTGKRVGGWGKANPLVWTITETGREALRRLDAEIEEAVNGPARAAARAADRTRLLAEAAALTSCGRVSRNERWPLVRPLRDVGCSLQEIGDLFDVSREMIRQDLAWTPKPARPQRGWFCGPELIGGMVHLKFGKRSLWLLPGEAAALARDLLVLAEQEQPAA